MKFPRSAVAALVAVFALALPGLAQADITQFRISNFGPDGDLTQQASLADPAYNPQTNQFFVVYEAGPKADDNHWDIWGQRLDAAGVRIGDPVLISTPRPGVGLGDDICFYDPPAVAYSPQLNQFMVSWNQGVGGNCDDKIMARLVGADGVPVGDVKQISDTGYDDTETTEPAWNPVQNEWLIGWKAEIPPNTGKQEIFAQRLAPDLSDVGPNDLRLTHLTDTVGDNVDDAMGLAFDPVNNRYLFVFHGDIAGVSPITEAYGHLTDGNLTAIGNDAFQISHVEDTNASGYATPPRAVYDAANQRFFVGWTADAKVGAQVDNENEEWGQYVGADGSLIGSNIELSDMGPDGNTGYNTARPDLAYNPNAKELFVAFHGEDNVNGLVDNEQEVFGQRLDVTGAQVGDNDFRISHDGPDGDVKFTANRPALALNTSTCQFLVTWASGKVGNVGDVSEEFDIYGNLVDAPCPPLNQVLPAVSGTAAEGQTLNCSDGTWSGRGLAFGREWLRDGTPIAGATANSYLLTAGDATHQVACRVTATDPDGSATATSAAVTPTAKPIPVVVPPKDTTAPTCTLTIPKQKLKNVFKKGLKVTASCNEAAALSALMKATFKVPKKTVRAAKVMTVSTKRVALTKAGKVTFSLKLSKKAGKALGRIKTVKFTVQVTAKDAAGNSKRVSKSVTLKRK